MIGRYVVVLVGALAVTIGLLFFMQQLVLRVTGDGDGTLYFLINDVIPAPDRGRQLPQAPPPPQAAPTRPSLSGSADVQRGAPAPPETVQPDSGLVPPELPSVEGELDPTLEPDAPATP
jgi:hypothetical protein